MNDYIMNSNTCPDELAYLNSTVKPLSPCKTLIFENNGIRPDHLEFIKFMEDKFAGTPANNTSSSETTY